MLLPVQARCCRSPVLWVRSPSRCLVLPGVALCHFWCRARKSLQKISAIFYDTFIVLPACRPSSLTGTVAREAQQRGHNTHTHAKITELQFPRGHNLERARVFLSFPTELSQSRSQGDKVAILGGGQNSNVFVPRSTWIPGGTESILFGNTFEE